MRDQKFTQKHPKTIAWVRDQKLIIYLKIVGIKFGHTCIKIKSMCIYDTEELSDNIKFLAQQSQYQPLYLYPPPFFFAMHQGHSDLSMSVN